MTLPTPTARTARSLEQVRIKAGTHRVHMGLLQSSQDELWEAMRRARNAGATLGQIRQATVENGKALVTRARVQQITHA